jgi:hypothetical protein
MNLEDYIPGSNHFKWKEALYLPSWNCYHNPSQEEIDNIITMASIMDKIRDFLNLPINVHVWIRPILNNTTNEHHGEDYNAFIGGATHSAHKVGSAVDWDAGIDCDIIRSKLLKQLDILNIRMENNNHSNWVHTDNYPPNPHRYFIP